MWIAVVVIVVAIGIGLAIGIPRGKEIKRLREEGKITVRDRKFPEKGEEFTSKGGTLVALKKQLEVAEIPCALEGNAGTQVNFNSKNHSARLYKVDFDEPSGIGIFRFEFTHWKPTDYGYVDGEMMNMLMTSVEKIFLNLDPNTGVKTYDLDLKVHHSIF